MNKNIFPAIGIILVASILISINEFAEVNFIKDYAYLFLISAMLIGVSLTKITDKSKK
tara:strand:- start:230 stop:403 length:174 start_codon:yes stop_codon:yes gene_type:complete